MAGGQERILRRRIRTVQSTKKITRAMELIAASRIVKAQARVAGGGAVRERHHRCRAQPAVGRRRREPPDARRAVDDPPRRARRHRLPTAGLCGGTTRRSSAPPKPRSAITRSSVTTYALVTVGRKAEGYFRFRNFDIAAVHAGFSDNPSYEDARAIAASLIERYEAGELDLVQLVYTRFITAGRQEVIVRALLPLDSDEDLIDAGRATGGAAAYEFEPDPDAILDRLLPRYAEARVYAALLNAAASEHAARQRAMKAATDNADELILGLTRTMNRARQDSITTEIMEIVGGAEALRSGRDRTSTTEDAELLRQVRLSSESTGARTP